MVSTVRRYEITDMEWEQIKPYLPEEQGVSTRGRPSKDSRTMLNGIFLILMRGAAWQDVPERYGSWQNVYKRFVKWSEAGIFEKIFKDLADDVDMQDISIDNPCIKAHKASAGAKNKIPDSPKASLKVDGNAGDSREINAFGSLAVVEIPRSMQ